MRGISIKKAIESSAWYECAGHYFDEPLRFRIRVLGFSPTTVDEIDPKRSATVRVEGILWLLAIEIVNLCQEPVDPWKVRFALSLVDSDGFRFEPHNADNLDTDRPSGLHRFSGWSDNPKLSPKIKASGSIAFVLPDQESSYQLVIKDGQIREV